MIKYISVCLLLIVLIAEVSCDVSSDIQEFYKGCNKDKTCFGPEGCVQAKNCKYVISVQKLSKETQFKIQLLFKYSSDVQYLAVGFGKEARMKQLAVLECVIGDGDSVKGYASWVEDENASPTRIDKDHQDELKINLEEAGVVNDQAICTFRIPENFELPIGDINLGKAKETYYIQLAWGEMSSPDNLKYHGEGNTAVSEEAIDLNVVSEVGQGLYLSYKIHGVLMTFLYMGFIPIAVIIARFYKETWSKIRIFNKKLWFLIHMCLMTLSLIFGVSAYLLLGIANNKWWPASDPYSTSQRNHAILGMISLVLLLLQNIGPWLIPNSILSLKKFYFIGHTISGTLCYVLGILTIALSSVWVGNIQPCEGTFITAIWIAIHSTMYILLTTLLYIKDYELESSHCRALTWYPMKTQTTDDAPGATLRNILLVIFIIISLTFCITMSVNLFVGTACSKK